jgi:two-component system, OmpR family, sensor histidine kinase MprB
MSFRLRLTLVAAAAVGIAVVLASAVVYFVARSQLRGPIDDSLQARAAFISHHPLDDAFGPQRFGDQPVYIQVVKSNGTTIRPPDEKVPLPVDKRTLSVAEGKADPFFADMTVVNVHLRVLTFQYAPGYAVQAARGLKEVDHALDRLRLFLLLIAGGGIAVAALAGLLVTRAATAPVRRLTEATERVTETRDLSERIDAHGRDELSRLAASFNTMLAALEDSTRAQRQLVADASHELRTPLTSLRTNIEVLASERQLPPGERERLLNDVVEQLGEMTTLIAELIELAREEQHPTEAEDVRLDVITARAVARSRRNSPNVTFTTDLEESTVHGVPSTIERAVGNLLDNAGKWSQPGGQVDVAVRASEVIVRDHGPGIAEEDAPYVFDRFYRASSARGMPGSGLGLAIVRQVARAHGGEVTVEHPPDGGTRMRLRLNGASEPEPSSS